MSIATRAGDGGITRLMYGERVSKADVRVEAYGTIDELNAFMGLARAACDDAATCEVLLQLQRDSFVVGGELATPPDRADQLKARVDGALTAYLDSQVTAIEELPGLLGDWALPGATPAGAALDVARTVARRAERQVVRLHDAGALQNPEIVRYLNRLSDLLWLLGRRYEMQRGAEGALRPGPKADARS